MEKDNKGKILNKLLGNPAECMQKLELNPNSKWFYIDVFAKGIEQYVILVLHNEDYSFDENTLTIERNIELLKVYFDYLLKVEIWITKSSIADFAKALSLKQTGDMESDYILDQLMQIAKPYMKDITIPK